MCDKSFIAARGTSKDLQSELSTTYEKQLTVKMDSCVESIPKVISFNRKSNSSLFQVYISTATQKIAGTDKPVYVQISGDYVSTDLILLDDASPHITESGMQYASADFVDPEQQGFGFPSSSVREFGFEAQAIGNIVNISLIHDPNGHEQSAWRPESVLIVNNTIQRAWVFESNGWLSHGGGNQVVLKPEAFIYSGNRSCIQAAHDLTSHKTRRFQGSSYFKTPIDRKEEIAATSSFQEKSTRMLRFHFRNLTETGTSIYLLGSTETLGKWNPENALRMLKRVSSDGVWRGDWQLQMEMDYADEEIKYTYITIVQTRAQEKNLAYVQDKIHCISWNQENQSVKQIESEVTEVRNTYGYGGIQQDLVTKNQFKKHTESMTRLPDYRRAENQYLGSLSLEKSTPQNAIQASTEQKGVSKASNITGKQAADGTLKKPPSHESSHTYSRTGISDTRDSHHMPDFFVSSAIDCHEGISDVEYEHFLSSSIEPMSKIEIEQSRQKLYNQIQVSKKHTRQTSALIQIKKTELERIKPLDYQDTSSNDGACIKMCETGTFNNDILVIDSDFQNSQKSHLIQIRSLRNDLSDVKNCFEDFSKYIKRTRKCLETYIQKKDLYENQVVEYMRSDKEEIVRMWKKELNERRNLFNKLRKLQGNVRVLCRLKPVPRRSGIRTEALTDIDCEEDSYGSREYIELGGKRFRFDHIFSSSATQEEVYSEMGELAHSVLDGYNACILAYGQTGSGKTYTMNGTKENRGINYRIIQDLFDLCSDYERKETVSISFSILEVYNESLVDLLEPFDPDKKLEIRKDTSSGYKNSVRVQNLKWIEVETSEKALRLFESSLRNRSLGSTDINSDSSRSHLIVKIKVVSRKNEGITTSGEMTLVDLAGSERTNRSNVSGARMKEAQHINKSLSALGDVFSSLISGSVHVPYRNSKLTYLLQDCIGGNSKTLMFVNVSLRKEDYTETMSTLEFSQRASKVVIGKAMKNVIKDTDKSLRDLLESKESHIKSLQTKYSKVQKELKKR